MYSIPIAETTKAIRDQNEDRDYLSRQPVTRANARSHRSESHTQPTMNTINLEKKLSEFSEHWQPRTVGQFNGHDLMVVKVKGEFVWHKHEETDDFFMVLSGRLRIQLRDGDIVLAPGEVFVVPRGVEHCPVADVETHVLLIEPQGTPNTGDHATAQPRRVI